VTSLQAVEVTQGPVVDPTPTNAVIRWSTDTTAGGRVHYGTSVRQMELRAVTGKVGATHEVSLRGLKPGTTYWYSVGSARLPLLTNSFTTPGRSGGVLERASSPSTPAVPSAPGRSASASNGNPPPAAAVFEASKLTVPPSRKTWGAPRTLQDHFDRHGQDFAAKNPDDYAAQAWLFLRRARAEGLPAKIDEDGVLRVYEPKTRAFAAYNRDLTTKTYFKPGRRDYFDDQPGKPVDLEKLVK